MSSYVWRRTTRLREAWHTDEHWLEREPNQRWSIGRIGEEAALERVTYEQAMAWHEEETAR